MKVDELQAASNITQWPQLSPLDHTAISGTPFDTAYDFALERSACHFPGVTAAALAARVFTSFAVSPANSAEEKQHTIASDNMDFFMETSLSSTTKLLQNRRYRPTASSIHPGR